MKRVIIAAVIISVLASVHTLFAEDSAAADTLVITARLIEVPGDFPPNDLYSYVYIMKYRVIKVENGTYDGKEILVGVYNPLISRKDVKDKMKKFVSGDADKFEVGARHKLVLVNPIENVWDGALEDEYFDIDPEQKWYALTVDIAK